MKKESHSNANNGAHREPETETTHNSNVIDITQGPAPKRPNLVTRSYRFATRNVKLAAGASYNGAKKFVTSKETYKAIGRGALRVATIAALGFIAGAAGEAGSKYASQEMKRRSA